MTIRKGFLAAFLLALVPAAALIAADLDGYWYFPNDVNWDNALGVGTDADGSTLYVIRAYNSDGSSLMPGKYNAGTDTAYICYGGKEIVVKKYEVLAVPSKIQKRLEWVHSSSNSDGEPVQAGYDSDGSPLFLIAADVGQSSMTPGKFNPAHEKAYVPYGGKEVTVEECYFLVMK